jgi:prepilin-type N-terminal cleavage/methylation domain-containing protein
MRTPLTAPATLVRAGLTLMEIMVAMTVTSVLIAATVPFFVAQARAVGQTAARTDAHHNARYAVNTVDRDLRVSGVGVVDAQPMIVYAGQSSITINADLVSHTRDASAVYSDPDAPLEAVTSLGKASRITLPLSATLGYPDTTYLQTPGVPSAAETISYWLSKDSLVTTATQYILWRRVNDTKARVVAKGFVLQPGQPAFRYYKADSIGRLVEIDQTTLPLHHSAPIHSLTTGLKPDVGKSAMTDSIRAVGVRLVGRYFDKRRNREILDTAEALVRIPNAGLNRVATCGERPLFGQSVTAAFKVQATGEPSVQLDWTPAVDEAGGETDVERYTVYRRLASDLLFAEPVAIVPAGVAKYTYVDTDIQSGNEYVYGVSAQDCTPRNSGVSSTPTVVVP